MLISIEISSVKRPCRRGPSPQHKHFHIFSKSLIDFSAEKNITLGSLLDPFPKMEVAQNVKCYKHIRNMIISTIKALPIPSLKISRKMTENRTGHVIVI